MSNTFLQVLERLDAEYPHFWWFRIQKHLSYEKICTLLFVPLSHMIGLSSIFLQKTWNTLTLSNIYILMYNNKFTADFFLKTCNFHCSRKSKNWEFQLVQECQDLLRLLVCASWSCISVSWSFRDIAITTFWIYMPLLPSSTPLPLPLKKYVSSKICWKSHFSKSILLLILS